MHTSGRLASVTLWPATTPNDLLFLGSMTARVIASSKLPGLLQSYE